MGKPLTLRQFIVEHMTKERASLTIAAVIGFVMAIPTHIILNMVDDWFIRSLAFMCLFLVSMLIWHQAKDIYAYWRWRKRREGQRRRTPIPRDVEEYADAKVKDMLVKLEHSFDMILKRMKAHDEELRGVAE